MSLLFKELNFFAVYHRFTCFDFRPFLIAIPVGVNAALCKPHSGTSFGAMEKVIYLTPILIEVSLVISILATKI